VNWDGNTKKIIYCTSTSCCNAGFEVVPSYVESTDHDADWIVAKALHGDSTTYWIVDKRFKVDLSRCEVISCDSTVKAHTFGPLRYAAYLKAIDSLGIELRID